MQQLIGKLAPQRGRELRQALHRRQAVQPRHQRVVQGGRNRQGRQGTGQAVAVLALLEQAGLQHHLGQFLDKQGHAIGLGHDLLDHLRWQGFTVGHLADHLRGLAPRQPGHRHLGEVRAPRPWRTEVRTKGAQRQDAGGGALIDQEAEKLQRGRIDPVQVFHDKEHGLLRGDAQQDRQQGVQRLLLLLLGRHGQGGIVRGQRQGEQGGQEGHGLRQRQAMLHQEPFEFAELLLWGLLPLEVQGHPLQQLDHGIQGGVLVVGRTLARRQPRLGLPGHLFCQHLHQARFANARFAAEQHHLPEAVLDLRPALPQQPDFLLPAHQWGPPGAADGFQATARHTLIEHPIDGQRLRLAFQRRGP